MSFASRITGTGSAFPSKKVTNQDIVDDLARSQIETSHEWISERTGIRERCISVEGVEDDRNSSMAYRASLLALEAAGKTPEDLDQIVVATCSPDNPLPTTACWLHKKLGAPTQTAAWDLNAACSGFVYGAAVVDQLIRSGANRTILLVGSEIMSMFLNWKDRSTCILFGDGAGAAVLEQVPADSPSRILASNLGADGSNHQLFEIPAGGSTERLTPGRLQESRGTIQMQGPELFKIAVKSMAEQTQATLNKAGLGVQDLDWFIPHQANLRIIDSSVKRLKFPKEKVILNIDRYGNTSSATVPTALDEALRDGRIQQGQTVMLVAFGAGLTYGSLLFRA